MVPGGKPAQTKSAVAKSCTDIRCQLQSSDILDSATPG